MLLAGSHQHVDECDEPYPTQVSTLSRVDKKRHTYRQTYKARNNLNVIRIHLQRNERGVSVAVHNHHQHYTYQLAYQPYHYAN